MDRDDLRRALVALRVACDDADGVVVDMLRAPRRRELGPALHAKNYRDAREAIAAAIGYLMAAVSSDGGGPTDPAGGGGSPCH